jgi:hypothetical protein
MLHRRIKSRKQFQLALSTNQNTQKDTGTNQSASCPCTNCTLTHPIDATLDPRSVPPRCSEFWNRLYVIKPDPKRSQNKSYLGEYDDDRNGVVPMRIYWTQKGARIQCYWSQCFRRKGTNVKLQPTFLLKLNNQHVHSVSLDIGPKVFLITFKVIYVI